jgi:integrase
MLRHAHASMLIAAKVPITTVAARLGHADPAITLRIYAHLVRLGWPRRGRGDRWGARPVATQ